LRKKRSKEFERSRRRNSRKAKMTEKNTKDKKDTNVGKESLTGTEGELKGEFKEQKRPKREAVSAEAKPKWERKVK
jgi:hypothetical protein